ncbi:MAG: anaerobic ribonucleoside-triphosphate reductase activating protein [Proteobacteria bacterium]|nr:anaerobic ribonucleoside-triphosphate reductase activating protein [Pseudomonadota bacterium]
MGTPQVGGLVPFSTIDYPGQLAAVLFLQGCPWRCGYCHNPHLQTRTKPSLEWEQVIKLLSARKKFLDAVVLSGGEPTAERYLPEAIQWIREQDFLVGLHTAGIYPQRLKAVLDKLDWIGLDIKAPFEGSRYDQLTKVRHSSKQAQTSLDLVLSQGIDFEARTTFHPQLLTEDDLLSIARTLSSMGVQHYVIQSFHPRPEMAAPFNLYTEKHYPSEALLLMIQDLFPKFTYR